MENNSPERLHIYDQLILLINGLYLSNKWYNHMQKNELLIYILDPYIIILFIQYLLFSGIPRIFPETLNIFEFLLTWKKKGKESNF